MSEKNTTKHNINTHIKRKRQHLCIVMHSYGQMFNISDQELKKKMCEKFNIVSRKDLNIQQLDMLIESYHLAVNVGVK